MHCASIGSGFPNRAADGQVCLHYFQLDNHGADLMDATMRNY